MSRKNWTEDKLFFRLLNNRSDKTYWDNIRELRSRVNKNVFIRSFDLAKSVNDKEKTIGIDLLSQLGLPPRPFYRETIKLYFELLKKETNPKVIISILYGIGHNNEKLSLQQTALISSFKNSKDEGVRQGVVDALLSVDNKAAIDTLLYLTNDKASSIRDWATFGIGTQIERNTKSITEALWKRVDDKNQDTKLEAIVGLAKRQDSRVKEIIKRELKDGEFGTLLFEAIEELKGKEFLPLLKQNLKKIKGDKTINPAWTKDLKACIKNLSQSWQTY